MFLSFLIQTYHFVSVCPARLSCFIFALFICMDGIDFQLVRGALNLRGYAHCLVFLSVRSLSMISFFVVVTASLSESECKGRDFWDSGKMFGRVFAGFGKFSMNSDIFSVIHFD